MRLDKARVHRVLMVLKEVAAAAEGKQGRIDPPKAGRGHATPIQAV